MLLNAAQWRRLRRDSSAMFGLGLVLLLVVVAIVGPILVFAPDASHFELARGDGGGPPAPSWAHPLGADPLFRDVLARLVFGARLSLAIGFGATLLACSIAAAVGVTAGFLEGTRYRYLDNLLMRVVDIALAFPYLLLITAIGVAIDRADAVTVTLVLGLTSWTGMARVVRAKTLEVKQHQYVSAAVALGAGGWHIVRRHILPAITPILLVIGSQAVAQMILAEAVLSYLTVGIEPPHPTWGRMLHEAESYLGTTPLLVAAPGLAILLAVLGFARLGDGLRDAIDPRSDVVQRRGRARYAADLAVVVAAVVLVGFSDRETVASPREARGESLPRRGGVLKVATQVAVHLLDPALAYDEASRAIDDLLFATLVSYDHDGELVADLAERFELVEDGAAIRFTLRPNLHFHDGTSLGAVDVKRSLERTLHPSTPCPAASMYTPIRGYAEYQKDPSLGLSGVVIEDPLTVRVRLLEPDVTFLARMALSFAAPVCASSGSQVDPKTPAKPCGAGPFVLDRFDRGERVLLRRFDGYYRPQLPYLDGIEWTLDLPPRTQRYRFERGELDFVNELGGPDAFRFGADPRWEPYRHWVAQATTNSIFLNTTMAPFDNRHLRRAVAFAVDPSVLEQIRATVGEATRLIPPAVPGPDASTPMRRHDVDAALREMALAGYPYDPATGRGGYPEEIDYLTIPDTFEQAAGEVFQQQLAGVGLRIRLRLVSWASWLALITKPGQVSMGWRGWGADFPDPSNFFEPILVTDAIQAEGSQNVSFFSHPELDRVVAEAHRETRWPRRMQLYQRAEAIVRDEAPLIPVYWNRNLQLHQPRVHGYRPHPVIRMQLREVWLAEEAR